MTMRTSSTCSAVNPATPPPAHQQATCLGATRVSALPTLPATVLPMSAHQHKHTLKGMCNGGMGVGFLAAQRTLLLIRLGRLCGGQHPVVAVRARHGRRNAGRGVHPGRQVDRPADTPPHMRNIACLPRLESFWRPSACSAQVTRNQDVSRTLRILLGARYLQELHVLLRRLSDCVYSHGHVSARQSASATAQCAPAKAAARARLALALPPQPQRPPPRALAGRPQHFHNARHRAARHRR